MQLLTATPGSHVLDEVAYDCARALSYPSDIVRICAKRGVQVSEAEAFNALCDAHARWNDEHPHVPFVEVRGLDERRGECA